MLITQMKLVDKDWYESKNFDNLLVGLDSYL